MDILTISIALMLALYGLIAVAGAAVWLGRLLTLHGPSGATFGQDWAWSAWGTRPRPAAMNRPTASAAMIAVMRSNPQPAFREIRSS